MVDVSAIITFHNEGLLANAALKSAARARSFAEQEGLQIETIAIADNPDDATHAYLKNRTEIDALMNVSFGDPGQARNAAIASARGKWVALLDGDDLWGENWLAAAHKFGEQQQRPTILHSQATLYFGLSHFVCMQPDMDDEDFELPSVAMLNCWTALSFALRSTYDSVPFVRRDLKRQIGFEDWGWNLDTIARGFIHKCVPNSLHAVRLKDESVVRRDTAVNALPAPTMLFRDILSRRMEASTAQDMR